EGAEKAGTGADNTAVDETAIVQGDLAVTVDDSADSASPGTIRTYTVTATNGQATDVTGATVDLVLTGPQEVVSGTSGGGAETATTVQWAIPGSFAAGASATFTVQVRTVLAATEGVDVLAGTATVADDGSRGADKNPSNNTAVNKTSVVQADLAVTLTDSSVAVTPGTTRTYQVTVSNKGVVDVRDAEVVLALSGPQTVASGTSSPGGAEEPTTVTWRLGPLAAGATTTVPFQVDSNTALSAVEADRLVGTATVVLDPAEGSEKAGTGADNTAVDETGIVQGDLAVTIEDSAATASPGTVRTYTVTAINSLATDVTGATVSLVLTGPQEVVAGTSGGGAETATTVEWTIPGTFPAGASQTFTVQARTVVAAVEGVDVLVGTATLADDGTAGADTNPADNTAVDKTSVLQAELAVAVTDSAESVTPGAARTYEVTVSNQGVVDVRDAEIVLTLSGPQSVASGTSSPGGAEEPTTVIWRLGPLTAGATTIVPFRVEAATALEAVEADALVGTATVVLDPAEGSEKAGTDADNTAVDETAVVQGDLGVTVTDNETVVGMGVTRTYEVTVTNTLDVDETGLVVTLDLTGPQEVVAVDDGGTKVTATQATWTHAGPLPAGESVTFRLTATVTTAAADGDTVAATATVTQDGTRGAETVTANNTATDETGVSIPPLPAAGTRVSVAAAPGGVAMLLLGGLLLVFGHRIRRQGRIA
ncbi:MAG: DUF11 domain-containing protein, partial [Propionibacteriaceae bacterium]|nr:DUF11 domain-containing protein [Propionibacteriaceae bacterium]